MRQHIILFILCFILLSLVLIFKQLYQLFFMLPVIYFLLLKICLPIKNKVNTMIICLFCLLLFLEIAHGSPTRAIIHKKIFYNCYNLENISRKTIIKISHLTGNQDILIDQILYCKVNGYDNFLLDNIHEDAPDEIWVFKTFTSNRAINIYKYFINKYHLIINNNDDVEYIRMSIIKELKNKSIKLD